MNKPYHVEVKIKFDGVFYPISQIVFEPDEASAKERIITEAEHIVWIAENNYGYEARVSQTTIECLDNSNDKHQVPGAPERTKDEQ